MKSKIISQGRLLFCGFDLTTTIISEAANYPNVTATTVLTLHNGSHITLSDVFGRSVPVNMIRREMAARITKGTDAETSYKNLYGVD